MAFFGHLPDYAVEGRKRMRTRPRFVAVLKSGMAQLEVSATESYSAWVMTVGCAIEMTSACCLGERVTSIARLL